MAGDKAREDAAGAQSGDRHSQASEAPPRLPRSFWAHPLPSPVLQKSGFSVLSKGHEAPLALRPVLYPRGAALVLPGTASGIWGNVPSVALGQHRQLLGQHRPQGPWQQEGVLEEFQSKLPSLSYLKKILLHVQLLEPNRLHR